MDRTEPRKILLLHFELKFVKNLTIPSWINHPIIYIPFWQPSFFRFASPCKGPRSISLSLPPSLPTSCWLYLPKPPPESLAAAVAVAVGPFDDDDGRTAATEQPNNLLLVRVRLPELGRAARRRRRLSGQSQRNGERAARRRRRKEGRKKDWMRRRRRTGISTLTCKIRPSFQHSLLYCRALGITKDIVERVGTFRGLRDETEPFHRRKCSWSCPLNILGRRAPAYIFEFSPRL